MTHPGAGFEERVGAAAAAGYDAIGLRPGDRTRALATGLGDADLRAMLSDHGVSVLEIDVLVGWGMDDDAAAHARRHEKRIYELSDALGARHVTVTGDLAGPWERSVELFAALCDRAAEHGLAVGIEFLPWTEVRDAATAGRLVADAGRTNGGVVVDSWHHFRGAASDDQLRALPPERVLAIQLDDGFADGSGSLLEQTFDRELPGDGQFDLRHFLRLLNDLGVVAPLCVEVISPRMARLSIEQACQVTADKTRAVLAGAFGSN